MSPSPACISLGVACRVPKALNTEGATRRGRCGACGAGDKRMSDSLRPKSLLELFRIVCKAWECHPAVPARVMSCIWLERGAMRGGPNSCLDTHTSSLFADDFSSLTPQLKASSHPSTTLIFSLSFFSHTSTHHSFPLISIQADLGCSLCISHSLPQFPLPRLIGENLFYRLSRTHPLTTKQIVNSRTSSIPSFDSLIGML